MEFGKDKVQHFFLSFFVTVVTFVFLRVITHWQHEVIVIVASAFAILLGSSKEVIWDKLLGRGDPSWGDMLADSLGVLLAVVLLVI